MPFRENEKARPWIVIGSGCALNRQQQLDDFPDTLNRARRLLSGRLRHVGLRPLCAFGGIGRTWAGQRWAYS